MKPKPSLTEFKVLVFDVYGTLIDWETGIYTALQPLLSRAKTEEQWSMKDALVAFSAVERDLQAQHPTMRYSELLAEAYRALAVRVGVIEEESKSATDAGPSTEGTSAAGEGDENEGVAFARSMAHWPIFSDTVAALRRLKEHYALVVLSNVDNASFHTFTLPQLDPDSTDSASLFNLILTAQDLGAYKPSPDVFTAALAAILTQLGTESTGVLVVAQSLFHDHTPAQVLGIRSAFIDREGACMGLENAVDVEYDFCFRTLGELAEATDAEARDVCQTPV